MALLLKDNLYFKIELDGHYVIYKNRAARTRSKKMATTPEQVLAKYAEILQSIYSPERNYYDYKNMIKEINEWTTEMNKYIDNLQAGVVTDTYPLMAQYVPEVDKTIPEIVERGYLGLANRYSTLEEVYQCIKNHEIFGPKDKIKDC